MNYMIQKEIFKTMVGAKCMRYPWQLKAQRLYLFLIWLPYSMALSDKSNGIHDNKTKNQQKQKFTVEFLYLTF